MRQSESMRMRLHGHLTDARRLAVALAACALIATAVAQGVSVGQPFLPFELRDGAGETVTSDDLVGRLWMVNLWATWCPPCRTELPLLARVADELADRGLGLLLLNGAEKASVATGYLSGEGLDLRTLVDPDERVEGLMTTTDFLRKLRFRGFPTTFFIDADYVVRAIYVGELTADTIGERLALLGLDWSP
jgi:thiol-disulfide isomerase/thioredoxin